MIKLITKNKAKATAPKVSLNKMGTVIHPDVLASAQTINPNSSVSFRKRNSSKKVLYEWQVSPDSITSPREINMGISLSSKKVNDLIAKKHINVKYKTIVMQQLGDLGGKYTIGVRFNLKTFDKNNLKLYSVDLESGEIEKKDQKLEFDENTGLLHFQVAYGGIYIVTEGELNKA
ncbi:hypothetical protein FACS189481_5220 [Clostridia bacterium]|nr:hypothetical protein FACS189481_5220 [Clostridia bacterium]